MSEWATALIAAASALAGSLITGWFSHSAGNRQAAAARHAGDRQADAMLDTVRATLEEGRAAGLLATRRQTYVRFLDAAESMIVTRRSGEGSPDDRTTLQRAYANVLLEGPAPVAAKARTLTDTLRTNRPPDDLERARSDFLAEARAALGMAEDR